MFCIVREYFDMILVLSLTQSRKIPLAASHDKAHRHKLLFDCEQVVKLRLSMQQCFAKIFVLILTFLCLSIWIAANVTEKIRWKQDQYQHCEWKSFLVSRFSFNVFFVQKPVNFSYEFLIIFNLDLSQDQLVFSFLAWDFFRTEPALDETTIIVPRQISKMRGYLNNTSDITYFSVACVPYLRH